MADSSGVSPTLIRANLTEKLEACHIEISDISGKTIVHHHVWALTDYRWLWTSLRGDHSLCAFREEEHSRTASSGQHGAQGRDSSYPRLDAKVLHSGRVGEKDGGRADDATTGSLETGRDVTAMSRHAPNAWICVEFAPHRASDEVEMDLELDEIDRWSSTPL